MVQCETVSAHIHLLQIVLILQADVAPQQYLPAITYVQNSFLGELKTILSCPPIPDNMNEL